MPPPLTAQDPERFRRRRDDRALFERLDRDGDPAARAELVERYLPLARYLARRYRGGSEDLDDLEQVAAIGLVKAIDRFDVERGPAFSSFAFPTIVGELRRHFRDHGWSVRVPRDIKELFLRVESLATAMSGELGRAPTVCELAGRADATVEHVLDAMQLATARHAVSLDQPRPDGEDSDAPAYEVATEEAGFAAAEAAAMLEDLLRLLPERDRLILTLRFRDDLLQWQIAQATGFSQMHVSRLIAHSIATLQRAAEQRSVNPPDGGGQRRRRRPPQHQPVAPPPRAELTRMPMARPQHPQQFDRIKSVQAV
jgi:RNA polymerase sigma-B factor